MRKKPLHKLFLPRNTLYFIFGVWPLFHSKALYVSALLWPVLKHKMSCKCASFIGLCHVFLICIEAKQVHGKNILFLFPLCFSNTVVITFMLYCCFHVVNGYLQKLLYFIGHCLRFNKALETIHTLTALSASYVSQAKKNYTEPYLGFY